VWIRLWKINGQSNILTSAQEVWELISKHVREQLSDASWNTWFIGSKIDPSSTVDNITILFHLL
jgi:hypothetical protein